VPGAAQTVAVTDSSQVGEARRVAKALAQQLGFSQADQGKAALITTEMATNLVRHVPEGGELVFQSIPGSVSAGLELLALDKGQGIYNLGEAMRDGFSTTGGPGTGLGAIRRLAADFDLYSHPGQGTAMMARLWRQGQSGAAGARGVVVSGLSVAKPGQLVCGDSWEYRVEGDGLLILVADGLGHGPDAAAASLQAAVTFKERSDGLLERLLQAIHGSLRPTRGAAVAITRLNPDRQEISFAGVGNIAGAIVAPDQVRHLVTYPGTAGHSVPKIQQFNYPWPADGLLVLHSDGLFTRWSLDPYPGLLSRHPSLIAAILYRDFRRGNDDLSVVVARRQSVNETTDT
jgi:anti-sigma regulatory factor (Ser/Thr protein kinase)